MECKKSRTSTVTWSRIIGALVLSRPWSATHKCKMKWVYARKKPFPPFYVYGLFKFSGCLKTLNPPPPFHLWSVLNFRENAESVSILLEKSNRKTDFINSGKCLIWPNTFQWIWECAISLDEGFGVCKCKTKNTQLVRTWYRSPKSIRSMA